MDNRAISRHLRMMANLYDIEKDQHPLSARYRKLAEEVRTLPYALKDQLDQYQDREKLPFDQYQSLFQLIHHGVVSAFTALPIAVPHTLRQILALPGIGPNITRILYRRLGITNLEELKKALHAGRLDQVPEIPEHILHTLGEKIRKLERRLTLVPLEMGQNIAYGWQEHLLKFPGIMRVEFTGALRRQHTLFVAVELLAEAEPGQFLQTMEELQREGFTQHPLTNLEGYKDTLIKFQLTMTADDRQVPVSLYLTVPNCFSVVSVFMSGDDSHCDYLGYHRLDDFLQSQATTPDTVPRTEAGVYLTLGKPYILPELREQGSIENDPQSLIKYPDLQGDMHMHTTYSDGAHSVEDMVRGCIARGYQYMTITDHSQSLHVANGLSVKRLQEQHEEILRMREKYPEIVILHGTEVDILTNATLDFADDILGSLDLVVASIHNDMYLSEEQQTARILAAIESPFVHIIGHPTGRMIGRRDSFPLDYEKIFAIAAKQRVALELNSNPQRLDLDPELLRLALEAGCLFSIDSDAHSLNDLERVSKFGITQARRGWLTPDRVINSWSWEALSEWLR